MSYKKLYIIISSLVLAFVLVINSMLVIAAPKKVNAETSTSGSIKVQFYNHSKASLSDTVYPEFRIYNTGTSSINLYDIKVRYYYTIDGETTQNYWCDWSSKGSINVRGSFFKMTSPSQYADYYLEIGFTSGAGTLSPGTYVEVQSRFAKSTWTSYTQTNDYSFNSTTSTYTDWSKVTGYINGVLAWGTEPAAPSPTPTVTPTPTPTITPTP
ncbi:MAG: cellulose binding domain-containing protein, partial [Bacillota bacterium]